MRHIVQDVLDDALLARYVTFKPGEPYSVRSVLDLQSALSASGYFGQVEVKALREEAKDRRVPLEVRLTRGKRNM